HDHAHGHDHDHGTENTKRLIGRLAAGTIVAAIGFFAPLNGISEFALFFLAYLIVGGDILFRAIKNILRGQVFDEHFLMSIATLGAFAIQEYPEGVAVMLFYQIGELFQGIAVNRSRKSITSLMDIR
ncbi:heavy metal translocating P-type ATPase, partial [Bacillus paranthracis]|nr:heavy metal translocating P-type ATPase [Bacillus paranthracis]